MTLEIPNYTLLRQLGSGAMADVWLAEHCVNRRMAAIKILKRPLGDDADAEVLFLREGEVLAGFRDQNIVAIYDNARIGDRAYLAMEYLGGGSLLERMGRGPITVGEALACVAQLARALGVVHRIGVIHRDLKPANIMFRDDGTPVLTDFGASRVLDRSTIYGKDGGIIGTPVYMSPEQIQGLPLDGRSDLYSLGVIFFELLTGDIPYRGGSLAEIASQHLLAAVPRLPADVGMLQPVLDRLLAKAPAERFADADALVDALRSLYLDDAELRRQVGFAASSAAWSSQLRALGFHLDSQGRTDARVAQGEHLRGTAPAPPMPPAGRLPRRRWLLPVALAAAALVLLGWRYWPSTDERHATAPARASATCSTTACSELRRLIDAAGDGFQSLRGEPDPTGLGWAAAFAPRDFGHCRIDSTHPSPSYECRNSRVLDERSRADLFARTRAALFEALPGRVGSDRPGEFVLHGGERTAMLYSSRGADPDPYRLHLVVSPRASTTIEPAPTCEGLCLGLCRIANSAGTGYGLPQAAAGDPRPLDGGFVPTGAESCVGTRADAEPDTAPASGYACSFGSYGTPQEADREFERVGAALRQALWSWPAAEVPPGARADAAHRQLRVGNGELIAELERIAAADGHRLRLQFRTHSSPTFSPLCR